ncbi:MAG: hypothetical protein KDK99_14470 [Verrucomicrobiales bacterium]|nr:hypothetical protein [Verrucomicrobiales bacterium]
MFRPRSAFSWLLAGAILILPALLHADDYWREQLRALDQRHASQRQPLIELMQGELETRVKLFEKQGQPESAKRLQPKIDALAYEAARLRSGSILLPGSVEDACQQFLLAAAGWEWSIDGTVNVRRVTIMHGQLQTLDPAQGLPVGTAANELLLPGLFRSSRTGGGGWTYYWILPDLLEFRCVVTRDALRGSLQIQEHAQ